MTTKIIYRSETTKVIALYRNDALIWTTTYNYDADGYVENMVRVLANGTITNQ